MGSLDHMSFWLVGSCNEDIASIEGIFSGPLPLFAYARETLAGSALV